MQSNPTPTRDGSAWAAVFAAAIGCASFGLLVDLAEASKAVSKLLNFYNPTGDLSGKSTIGIIIWLAVWANLHVRWRGKNVPAPGRVGVVSAILILLALVMTFPPFFTLFG